MAVICRVCKEIKEVSRFVKNNQRKSGYDTKCKSCHSDYNKKYVVQRRKENYKLKVKIAIDKKYCLECFIEKPINAFVKCFSSKDGHRNKCAACGSKKQYELQEARMRHRINNNIILICVDCNIEMKSEECWRAQLKAKNPRCKKCTKKRNDKWSDLKSISTQCKVTRAQYNTLLEKQNNVCAICETQERRRLHGKTVRLCVDHCHKSGKIRGLLCSSCNQSLGLMKDNPSQLRAAANYLELHVNP